MVAGLTGKCCYRLGGLSVELFPAASNNVNPDDANRLGAVVNPTFRKYTLLICE